METKNAFNVPHAQSTVFDELVFFAGMVGVLPGTRDELLGFRAQAKQAIENLLNEADANGVSPKDIVKCNVYLRDMNNYDVFQRIYQDHFGDDFPAIAVMEVPSLPGPFEIEIDGFGVKREARATLEYTVLHTAEAPSHAYAAQGIKLGKFIYTSAQLPICAENAWPVEGYQTQIRQAMDNALAVVKAGGGEKKDIIKVKIYLKDMSRFDDFNAVYGEYFSKAENPPARSCFGVSELPGPYECAIECVAYLGDDAVRLFSEDAPVFALPFCQGVKAGNMIFVSGQVGYEQHSKTVPESFEGQTRQMMKNMFAVAEQGGATPNDFVKTQCFLDDIRAFDFFNRIYKEYFQENAPARSTFEINRLGYGYIVEIDGVACVH